MIVQLNGLDNVGAMGFSLKPPKAVRKVVKKALPVLKTVAKVAAVAVPALAIAGKAGFVAKAVKTVGSKVATVARLKRPASVASKVNTLKKSHDKFSKARTVKTAADAARATRAAVQQRATVMPQAPSAPAGIVETLVSAATSPTPVLNTAPTMSPLSVSPGGAPTPAPADSGTAAGTPAGATGAPFIPDAAASVAAAQETDEAPAQPAAKAGLPSWVIPAGVGLLIVGAVVSGKKKGARK